MHSTVTKHILRRLVSVINLKLTNMKTLYTHKDIKNLGTTRGIIWKSQRRYR